MIVIETPNFNIHAIDGYIETLYLVIYPDKILLLDGGCRCDVDSILSYFQHLERPISDLKLMIVTHPHPDHSAAAPLLQHQYGIPIASLPSVNNWYLGWRGWITQQTDIFLTYYVARKKKKPFKRLSFPRIIKIDYPLCDSNALPFFEDWQIISTPGHTTMDASLYNKDASIAYVADLLIGLKKRYSTPYPISDPIRYRQSLHFIKSLNPQHILLAHHGRHSITQDTWDTLIDKVSNTPKNHLNYIRKWLRLS